MSYRAPLGIWLTTLAAKGKVLLGSNECRAHVGSAGYTGREIGRAPVSCQSPRACWVADHNL